MTVLTVTITDPSPAHDTKKAEVAYLHRVLELVGHDLQAAQGNTASANIVGRSAAGVPNTTLGSWVYTAAASNP
jgi:hypothetical protein